MSQSMLTARRARLAARRARSARLSRTGRAGLRATAVAGVLVLALSGSAAGQTAPHAAPGATGAKPGAATGAEAAGTAREIPVAQPAEGEALSLVSVVERDGDGLSVRTVDVPTVAAAVDLAEDLAQDDGVVAAGVAQAVTVAADPYRSSQWAMDHLRAEEVLGRHDATGQVVAVLDTGVDATHPDLLGVVRPGRDFIDTRRDGRTDPNGHGTGVAGVIAAVTGNGIGVAGLARGAVVLPVRVMDAAGAGNTGLTAAGIVWAVDNGADVINLSLGGVGYDPSLQAAVDYALGRQVVVVAAAGNAFQDGNPVFYPAALPGVIGVGAVSEDLQVAGFSNQGSYVDVTAPGVRILTTTGGNYFSYSGTSFASPYVAAAAALLRAAEPGLTVGGVDARLVATATDAGPPGRDDAYGHGLLDLRAAFDAAPDAALGDLVLSPPSAPVLHGSPARFGVTWQGDAPTTGAQVALQELTGSGWQQVATRTVVDGAASFTITATRPGSFRAATGSQTSRAVPLRLVPRLSDLAASRTPGTFTVRGVAQPAVAKTVLLQRWSGTGWVEAARTTATTSFALSDPRAGSASRYRLRVLATSLTTVTGSSSLDGAPVTTPAGSKRHRWDARGVWF